LDLEIRDKNGTPYEWDEGPMSVTGGRSFMKWDGRVENNFVNQSNNPYYISLVLRKDEQEVARSASHKIWIGRPVILLHGIWKNKEYMESTKLYSSLNNSFNVSSVEYNGGFIGSMVGDIKQYAGKLDKQIDLIKKETGAGKVDIVAHSMGGLVARWYIQKISKNDVGKLIMIGTPNHGSEWSNAPRAAVKFALKLYFSGTNVLAEYSLDNLVDMLFAKSSLAGLELAPHSQFLQDLNNNNGCAYFVEKGEYDDEISESSRYAVLSSKYSIWTLGHKHLFGINSPSFEVPWKFEGDFMVPVYSAKLSDVSIWSESDVSHGDQDKDPAIIDQTRFLLQQPDELIQYSPSLNEQPELDANGSSVYWTTPIEDLILPGEVKSYNIRVDTSSTEAQFMIVWENGTINVTLTAPNGTEIEIPSEGGYAFYSVQILDPGNWTAEISTISIPANGTNITIQAFISNPLFIGVNTEKTVFNPQEPIKIAAYLGNSEYGFAGALVMANISKPDNTIDSIRLYDDGLHNDNQTADGIYANEFTNTSMWGAYQITISACGDANGNDFEREAITTVWVELYPDLTLYSSDIYFSNSTPISGDNITLTAEIHNIGDADAGNSSILFYDNDPASGTLIGKDVININKGSFEKAEAVWKATPGQHEIYVWISPYNSFFELNYSNNMANKSINVSIANNSCISGTKFNDTNSNATRDPGEAGLSGWTIRLTRPDGASINATTDASGAYEFENLTSGTYRVSEIRQSNWTQTYPAWLGDHIINITDGNITGVDFGNNYLPVPEIPFPPSGPASGVPGAEYSYTTTSTDPSGYQIAYTFDWGDGSNFTTGLFDSGAVANAAHIWNSSGVYQVRAMATNSKGASSGWSSQLEVTIEAGIIPDQIGVFRNGGLYFDANGDRYWTAGDTMGWFGTTGDLPVAGDWDGDGKDEIAVFRNGGWYLDANGEGYWTTGDTTGWFGATGDLPAAGDWDGDGKDEIAVFRNGGWYFDANGDRYWTTGDTTGWFGAGGDRPVAGRWGLLSFLALDQDKPQVALNEQPAEKIRQKKAALEELQEERRNQISEIKLRAATPS